VEKTEEERALWRENTDEEKI